MKPFYTKATTEVDPSIKIRYDEQKSLYPHWHYHDEYELVFIHRSSGIRYVGDSINPFEAGDFVLIGSGLPHIWLNEDTIEEPNSTRAAATVIHFQKKFLNNGFFELPLMNDIKKLFEKSEQGIRFINIKGIESKLNKIEKAHSAKRIIEILDLLHRLSQEKKIEILSSAKHTISPLDPQSDRIIKVHNYIAQNFRNKIKLENLAQLVHMTPQAFCNYFKKKNKKPVFTYINDLRIGYSCKMLIEKNLNIEQVALECGYNNTTFFNRKFKEKMKMTPKEYRNKYLF